MNIIALFTSFIIGGILTWRLIDHILMVIFHLPYIRKDKYMKLYDSFSSRAYSELAKGHKGVGKSYEDYVDAHKKAKPDAYKRLIKTIRDIVSILMIVYLIVFLVLALVFTNYMMSIVIGLLSSSILYGLYVIYYLHRNRYFYYLMMSLPSFNY